MTVEHDLSARLSALADDLTWADPTVSPEAVITRHRRQRRARAGLVAAAAAVVAVVVAVPTAIGSLSAEPGEAAGPGGTTAPATTDAEAVATEEARAAAAEASAAADARAEAEAAEFAAFGAQVGGPLVLSAPAAWDSWVPGATPAPAVPSEEDAATCPLLSPRFGAALGGEFVHAADEQPRGPVGCTWFPVPRPGEGMDDYVFSVVLLRDGTTVDGLQADYAMTASGPAPCWTSTGDDGTLLVRCPGMDERFGPQLTVAVPDTRGAGLWVLSATAQLDTGRPSVEAMAVLVEGLRATFG
ncbi:hypothetical protein [Blastococcus sp. TF02A-26]|uniref:hypothetical protein n=1 Tax=Blastococcus sp. TF02A-26 TaxID=2250577 RepID=UPI000DEB83F7|nr:hypothetical protein [Blastococcus sp. TF02A-26]RBY87509.1 hypothetical protein DQ240_07995 [Blastococcus sp. TF02A-26]